ncbi:chromosome-associated kinesin KIF4A-like [Ornithodoros turicata]|uniref:chromosome-associated kinesin KIF4A-like n=1 Tax=Ornithodoros turicata TaxID=34597 RepID=UPI003138F8D2
MEKCIPVRVGLRCRPLITKEVLEGSRPCVKIPDSCQVILGTDKAFSFDYVFGPEDSQKLVYEGTVSKLIPEIFKGYNVTVLAYGQTGSGKTFSMGTCCTSSWQGVDSDAGIIPRAVHDIFEGVQQRPDKVFEIKASFLEVYKEDILDLFSKQQGPLSIREDSTGTIKVQNLSEIPVHDTKETLELLESGSSARRTAATGMNAHSSRSHAIFTLSVEQQAADDKNDTTMAKFHLVDLAGSERAGKTKAQGERLKEGININRGLLSLGNVISALCDESSHVPYRDSKLTRLLQDSLGGNSNTIMLACISPADSNFEETLNTLRYADRARKIKNKPVVNRDPQAMELMKLRQLVQQLQAQLEQTGQSPDSAAKEEHNPFDFRAILEEKKLLLQDNEKLHDTNRQLREALHKALDQLSFHSEQHIMDQMAIEKLRSLNQALSAKVQSLECATTDEEKAQILNDIQRSIHEYKEEEKLQHETSRLQLQPQKAVDLVEGSNFEERQSEEDAEDVAAEELNRTFRRAAMSEELEQLNKVLQAKEELASKMTLNDVQLEVVRREYEASKRHLESEMAELKKERDELSQALLTVKTSSVPKVMSEQRRKRIQELEDHIAKLRRKVQEQSKLVKMKEETEQKACKLQQEITAIKQTRVRLMRQLKEESEHHRKAQAQMDRKVRALQLKEQRQTVALAKLERQSALRMAVMQRRMNEAVAAKQRLEVAAGRRKDWKKHRGNCSVAMLSSRIKAWLTEEIAVLSDSKKVEYHLQSLLDSRKIIAEQLNTVKEALAENSAEEDAESLHKKRNELQKEIEDHTTQIKELQQKILEVDSEKHMQGMFEGTNNMREAQAISSCLLKMATEKDVEAYTCKMKQKETTCEMEELKTALEDANKKIEAMEKGFEVKMVELEKQHQEKTLYLLKHSSRMTINSNPDVDDSLANHYRSRECETSRLQFLNEELEKKSEEVEQLKKDLAQARVKSGRVWLEDIRNSSKKARNAATKPKTEKIKSILLASDWDIDLDESIESQENDPDWSLEREQEGGCKRKSSEKEKARKTLKRSSSSMLACKCQGQCHPKRCGCTRKGISCTQVCGCKGSCSGGTSMEHAVILEEPEIMTFKDAQRSSEVH